MNIKALLLFPIAAFLVACATPGTTPSSTTPQVSENSIEVALIDEGVYETLGEVSNTPAPSTAAGRVAEHGGLNLLSATNSLVAKKGVTFGYRFLLRAMFDGPVSDFDLHVAHPPMRGVDGKLHITQTVPIEVTFEAGIAYHDIVYILSEDFEVLPGEWRLEVRFKGQPLFSRRFELRPQ